MADRVQQSLEQFAPELASYASRGIFSPKQIAKITEIRRGFETRLQRVNKLLNDFIQYIEAEKTLERLRNKRIRQHGAPPDEADRIVTDNILNLYRRAIHFFDEPALLKEFSDYAISKKAFEILKATLAEKCAKRVRDTDLWIYAAQRLWDIGAVGDARALLLKCSSVNSEARVLIELFRLECAYAEKLYALNRELGVPIEEDGDVERGEVAWVVFQSLCERVSEEEMAECQELARCVPGLLERMSETERCEKD